ncbi:MAG: flagellar cap protein FliD N-terminal domain-containing protein, partial [Angelakisella sp.]
MAINSLSSSSHGLSGLVSGMDTQSMVDSMLAGTQAKIDKAKASKTILGYKRQIYRDSMSSMKAFQKNFFSFGGSNNMLSSSFYNSMTAVNASKAFKATATGGANTGKTTVNSIQQLAQSLKYKSQLAETAAKVEGKLDIAKLKNGTADGTALEIQLQLDGISKTIKLPQGTKDLPLTEEEFVKQLNASIKHAFGSGVSAELSADKTSISFTPSDASREFYITGNINAMSVLGLKTGSSNKINTRMQLGDLNFAQKLQGTAFKFKINGVEIAANADESLDTVISRINNSEANVKVRYSAIEDKFSIESTVSGKDTKIEMSQSEGNLLTSLFGVGSGGAITSQTQYTYGNITSKLSGVTDKSTPDEIAKIVDAMNSEINRYAGEAKGSFVLNVDGKDITVELAKKDTGKYDFMDLQKAITDNAELKAKGVTLEMGITTASDGTKSFTGDVTLSANAGVKLAAGNGMSIVGIKGNNESVITAENAKTATLASMGMANGLTININGTPTTFTKDAKFADVLTAIETKMEDLSIEAAKKGGVALTPEQETAIRDKISFQVLEAPPESKGKVRLFGVDIPIDITIIGDDKKL